MRTLIKNTIKHLGIFSNLLKKEWFSLLLGLCACFYYVCPSFNGNANVILFCSFALYVMVVIFWWHHMIVRFIRYGISKDKKLYKRVISLSFAVMLIITLIYLIAHIAFASYIIATI